MAAPNPAAAARLDEVAPADGRLIPKLGDLCFAFFDHD